MNTTLKTSIKTSIIGLVAICSVAGGFSAGGAAASSESKAVVVADDATCPKDGKIDTPDGPDSVTVTAPDGMLIAGYCVKAGSANQGLGPESFVVDPPVKEITFSHSSGKAISHYTVVYVDEPLDDKAPPPEDTQPDVPTTDVPTTDVPTTDVPATDVPTTDVPATDVPAVDVPQPEVPEVEQTSDASAEQPQVEVAPPVPQAAPTVFVPGNEQLPSTGSTSDFIALLAGAAMAVGAVTLVAARRRNA